MDLAQLFAAKEQEYGLPAGYLMRTAQIESSLDPNAKNPNSSAGGLFQFIDSTANDYGLQNRFDPMQATDAAARLARDNAAALSRGVGRAPTAAELYLAHQQGAGGALRLLRNPGASAASLVGGAAAGLNGGNGQTAGDFVGQWNAKFGAPRVGGAGGGAGDSGQIGQMFTGGAMAPMAAPEGNVMGQIAAQFLQNRQEQQKAQAEQQAAEQERKNALFAGPVAGGGGLGSLYG